MQGIWKRGGGGGSPVCRHHHVCFAYTCAQRRVGPAAQTESESYTGTRRTRAEVATSSLFRPPRPHVLLVATGIHGCVLGVEDERMSILFEMGIAHHLVSQPAYIMTEGGDY